VGSKEGWQPATFVSSRSKRAKYEEQKAEDYMDQEDLKEKEGGERSGFRVQGAGCRVQGAGCRVQGDQQLRSAPSTRSRRPRTSWTPRT
jgi:hypothetical protein